MKRLLTAFASLVIICALLALYIPGGFFNRNQSQTTTTPPQGGVLNLYGTDPYTLDPATIGDSLSNSYAIQIFSGLVKLGDSMEPAPDIAEDWDISDDGKTYTFYLKDKVFFHSGKQVKAADFKYSWERACNPQTGSQTAATYLGDIVGVAEMLAGEETEISGVEVAGDYTLRVTIDEPKSYFLYKLANTTAFVVNRDNVESGAGWWHSPDGSGPFKLKQWDEQTLLILERNGLYYGDIASLDYINYHLWAGVPMNLYETGEIGIAGVGVAYIDKITDPDGDFYDQLEVYPSLSVYYLGFNCQQPPFDDPDIRRAFSLAFNKEKLVSLTLRDAVSRADGILPPGMPGYNEELDGYEYNVELALELIANSEYGDVSNLPPITITTGGQGGAIDSVLEAVIYEWRINLGVEVEVRQLEVETFLYELVQEKDEMYYWGWSADYPHPQNFLQVLFGSGSEYNIGGYGNAEVDAMLQAAGREQDIETSLDLYRQAEQMLIDDAACIPLWFDKNYVLIKAYVSGYSLNPLGYASLNEVSVIIE
ncbi:ABC transporter substrate-binding protein [Chloroflexota bacterium]